jgi:DnaJ-class molecular chaperone
MIIITDGKTKKDLSKELANRGLCEHDIDIVMKYVGELSRKTCTACGGSGHYKNGKCGACDGKGFEEVTQ